MDQRQTKIVEGAGLEESRLNTDFIRWLQRWGSPLLLVLAGVAGAYSAWNWWQRAQTRANNEARAQLDEAQKAGSPDGLLRIASDHAGRPAIAAIATLSAADVYLNSGMTRVAPGGKPENEADRLNDEQRKANLEQAKNLYTDVVAKIGADRDRALIGLNARFGAAAAAATLGDIPGATALYAEAAEAAKAANLPGLAERAERAKESLDRAAKLPPLHTKEAVAASARPAPLAPILPGGDPTALPDPGPLGPLAPDAPAPVAPDADSTPPAPEPVPPAPEPAPGEGAPKA